MSCSYNKLWKIMIDKGLNKTTLRKSAKITTNVLAKMGRDEPVSIEALEKICNILNCKIEEIVEVNIKKDNEK